MSDNNFNCTKNVEDLLLIDETNKTWKTNDSNRIFSFSDIASYRIIEDGHVLAKSNEEGVLVERLLDMQTSDVCGELSVCLTLASEINEEITINIIAQDTHRTSIFFKKANEKVKIIAKEIEKMIKNPSGVEKNNETDFNRNSSESTETGTTIDASLTRIKLLIEEGSWDTALERCESALDVSPTNATAYIYKLLIDYRVRSVEDLGNLTIDFHENSNYKNAVRFADEALKNKLERYAMAAQWAAEETPNANIASNSTSVADSVRAAAKENNNSPKKKKGLIIGIIVAAVVIIGVALFIFIPSGDTESSGDSIANDFDIDTAQEMDVNELVCWAPGTWDLADAETDAESGQVACRYLTAIDTDAFFEVDYLGEFESEDEFMKKISELYSFDKEEGEPLNFSSCECSYAFEGENDSGQLLRGAAVLCEGSGFFCIGGAEPDVYDKATFDEMISYCQFDKYAEEHQK